MTRQFSSDEAVVIMAFCMIHADGKIEHQEVRWINNLFNRLKISDKTINNAESIVISYMKNNDLEGLIYAINRSLSYNQRIILLALLYEAANVDGQLSDSEGKFLAATFSIFGINPEEFINEFRQLVG